MRWSKIARLRARAGAPRQRSRARPAAPSAALLAVVVAGCAAPVALEEPRGEVFVAAGAPLPADGTAAHPFATISQGLRAARGGTVRVGEGDYVETLDVSAPVVLLGSGPGRTRVVAPAAGDTLVRVGPVRAELRGVLLSGGSLGVTLEAGAAVMLENVELRGQAEGAVRSGAALLRLSRVRVSDVGHGKAGTALELSNATLEATELSLFQAGRRGLEVKGGRARFEQLAVDGSGLAALQITQGAEVTVHGGRFSRLGGAALYVAGSHLAVDDARFDESEYGVLAYRGARLDLTDSELFDHRVAAVAFVGAHGSVRRCLIARGGVEGGIAVAEGKELIVLEENQILHPGHIGIHITRSRVELIGNTVSGAAVDHQNDFGDGLFAFDADLSLRHNLLRDNAGSGAVMVISRAQLDDNDLIDNGKAGLSALDVSSLRATGNLFSGNVAGLELAERSRVVLTNNRFAKNGAFGIDLPCGAAGAGSVAEVGRGNVFEGNGAARRPCAP